MPRVRGILILIGFAIVIACAGGFISPWFMLLVVLVALMRAIVVVSLVTGVDDWSALSSEAHAHGVGMVTSATVTNLIGYGALYAVVYGVRLLLT